MMTTNIPPITLDTSGAIGERRMLTQVDLATMWEHLEKVRQELLTTDLELYAGDASEVPEVKQPLDAGFFELPEKILNEYQDDRTASELGQILATAARLKDQVDRVVVLGIGGSYMGARAMFEACCHPYHNELSRAERGGVPRIYFEGNNVDNDATAGLLDLLKNAKAADGVDQRWAIVVISKSGGTLETAANFRLFLEALKTSCDGDDALLGQLVVPVTGTSGKLFDLAGELGCPDIFRVPDGVGGRFSILSAVGLLPAAIMGLDVVKLLQGAVQINQHFRDETAPENIVTQFAGVCMLLEHQFNKHTRILSIWSKTLEAVGLWYDQLLAESTGKNEEGALPLTVVNTRDLHSRGQQHQEGRRDKMITNLVLDSWRRDPLAIGHSELNQDGLNELADKTLPEIMDAALRGTNASYEEVLMPILDLHLPKADEPSLGQFFQMLMIATVVEGRYLQINPYGQPGVEGYKKNMNAILRS